ncbi:DUF7577 domain-containing protein [Infirmifilum sp. SLHALR2]|nr:MAG: hypothetical protein B7L53_07325 [Thermofilum sp. NZ13]
MRVRALPLALLTTLLLAAGAVAQPYNLASVNWVKYVKLSGGRDFVSGTCIFGDYLAVVGAADIYPALVLLDRSTGEVVRKWVGNYYGFFTSCVSVGDALYVVGDVLYPIDGWERGGVILKFDKSLNLLNRTGIPPALRHSITYDGEYLYSGGYAYEDINGDGNNEEIWYIEKRTKSLELVKSKELYAGGWRKGEIWDVGVNPVTDELWAVGFYNDTSNKFHSLIIILDRELRELRRIDYPEDHEYYLELLLGVCFDNAGNAYVEGWRGIAKFDKSGNALRVNKEWGISGIKIIYANGFIYTFDLKSLNNYERHAFHVLDSQLNAVGEYVLGRSANASAGIALSSGKPCFDGRNIYFAGDDYFVLNKENWWVVYSIAVKPLPPVTVAVEGLPPSCSVPVYVNGVLYGYLQGGGSMVLNVSDMRVTVRVGQPDVGVNDTVYEAVNDTLTVSPGGKAVFRYTAAKFYVAVLSSLAPALGSGWYRRGDEARVGLEGLKDGYYYASDGSVRCRFEGWEVRKGNFSVPAAPSFSFSVSGPLVLEARFGPPEYRVCIDSACGYYEPGHVVPPRQDIPELGGLLVRRFEGYIDPSGNSLGRSFTVDGPVQAISTYRVEVNLLLLAAILVVLALLVIAVVLKSMRKAEREVGAGGGEAKAGGAGRVAAGELARVEGYLARLEELRREGRVSEEAYRRLREEYERERERLRELKPAQQAEHPTLRTCPKCGAPVEPEAKYCWKCGARL